MCALRLKAVKSAFEGKFKDAVAPFLGNSPDFSKLTCDAVNQAFIGGSEIVRRDNNKQAGTGTYDGLKAAHKVADSIGQLNKKNQEFWKRAS